MELSQSQFRV